MNSIIEEKTFKFSVRIVKLSKFLNDNKNEYTLAKQILRCGTSIGANVAEAKNAQSNNDFISKMSIALKETSETNYWLSLLYETDYIDKSQFDSMRSDCDEIYKVISSIILTSKEKL